MPCPDKNSINPQNRKKRFLRNLDISHKFHSLLSFFLFLEKFPFAGNVSAVTLRRHILAQRRDIFACNDLCTDSGLQRNLELMFRYDILELFDDLLAAIVRLVGMNDERQGIHRLGVHEDVNLDHF